MEESFEALITGEEEDAEARVPVDPIPRPLPPPLPRPVMMSGLYEWREVPRRAPVPLSPVPGIRPIRHEELRLDVDRHYPQLAASGTIHGLISSQIHWIARLKKTGPSSWAGPIWFKDGAVTSFPYTRVEIKATGSPFPAQRKATVKFKGSGVPTRTRTYAFKSQYFRPANFEFDWAEGEAADVNVDTCAHPNRPASLPCENLTIQKVFQRAGFAVTTNAGGAIPITGIGGSWSDIEMHDAMQVYWTRFANLPQWALWTFFAGLHESGTSLGGIMFDDIGPNHRQGTSLFVDSFIAQAPAGDPNPAAWVERMRFWTAVHEMGHAFNLAHSWQKSLGTPWIPLADEPEARSFMNYPYRVAGGQTAFFADFEYRFSNPELLFMRHAPMRYVQMGNADWFDHHGFEEANVSVEPALELTLRVNRDMAAFEFMEPVAVEAKLKNISGAPVLIDPGILAADALTLVLKQGQTDDFVRSGRPARQFVPYAHMCREPRTTVLEPGKAIYNSVIVSTGLNGWDVAEPGRYTIHGAVRVGDEDVISKPLEVRIAPPASREEETLAQEFFTEETGRILAVGGSRHLERGNAVLQEVAERLPGRRVAVHALIALGAPLSLRYKELVESDGGMAIETRAARPEEALQLVGEAVGDAPHVAAETLGHVRFRRSLERIARRLDKAGDAEGAVETLRLVRDTLAARNVLASVIEEIDAEIAASEVEARREKAKAKTKA
ncbi:MAG: hypothetical protein M3168_01005 [Actinomycetota bacterium]|nr:hypothetical protein [Actinomycetota bacterium]